MKVEIVCGVEGARSATGQVVVIDVLRAFTTAAYAFAAGIEEIELVATVEEARAREGFRMGEVGGRLIPGFDHCNSPHLLREKRLRGRAVMRTGSGTQGVVAAVNADAIWLGSLVVASATARALAEAERVTLVAMGRTGTGLGEEDLAGATFIQAVLEGHVPPVDRAVERVRASADAREYFLGDPDRPPEDLECAVAIDRFDFAMRVDREGTRRIARPFPRSARS